MYCNYSKGKFNSELTYIIPTWINIQEGSYDYMDPMICLNLDALEYTFMKSLWVCEFNYLALLKNGKSPQEARQVLPNALKADIVMTGFIDDWAHFFDLRSKGTTGTPHPDIKKLADSLYKEMFFKKII